MVRKPDDKFHFGRTALVCNLWGCNDEGEGLFQCARCKMVRYCGAVHQVCRRIFILTSVVFDVLIETDLVCVEIRNKIGLCTKKYANVTRADL